MTGYTVVVTLGKNVGDSPMQQRPWYLFRQRVLQALVEHGGRIVQRPQLGVQDHDQVGEWEGKKEWACTFVALFDGEMSEEGALICTLRNVGEYFHQATIGYICVPYHDNFIVV